MVHLCQVICFKKIQLGCLIRWYGSVVAVVFSAILLVGTQHARALIGLYYSSMFLNSKFCLVCNIHSALMIIIHML
jgi:hypothetical protein